MEQQYLKRLAEAYKRGYEKRYKDQNNAPELQMHYFKVKEDLPRVQVVLGFLQGIVPAGQCQSLLDVGSGRGAFLFPLLREFPELEVMSLDILPHRVELLQCLHDGGISNLHPLQKDICTWDAPDKSFDVVTMLEVMEHIPDTEAVVRNAVRVCRETDASRLMEGIYIKVEEKGEVVDRMKYVRASFLQTVEESQSYWLDRPIVPNRITKNMDELFL